MGQKERIRNAKREAEEREKATVLTVGIGIGVNLLIATVKLVIGSVSGSIAIRSEGINNATDALTLILSLFSMKTVERRAGKGEKAGKIIEIGCPFVISFLILLSGGEVLSESLGALLYCRREGAPGLPELLILLASGTVKAWLGICTVRAGRRVGSASLVGIGQECSADSLGSLLTVLSTVLCISRGRSFDAIAGLLISLLILKAGVDLFFDAVCNLSEAGT